MTDPIAHVYWGGDWFAERELDGSGTTVRLWPLRPDWVTVKLDQNGEREYWYRPPDGTGVAILRYKPPTPICAVCSKPITGEVRMMGADLMHPVCARSDWASRVV